MWHADAWQRIRKTLVDIQVLMGVQECHNQDIHGVEVPEVDVCVGVSRVLTHINKTNFFYSLFY